MSVRFPDVTVDCGGPDGSGADLILTRPRVIFEVLSPSTRRSDLQTKGPEYRAIPSVDTIVFIDPEAESVSVHQRIEGAWIEGLFSDTTDIPLPALGLTIPRAEVFARD